MTVIELEKMTIEGLRQAMNAGFSFKYMVIDNTPENLHSVQSLKYRIEYICEQFNIFFDIIISVISKTNITFEARINEAS